VHVKFDNDPGGLSGDNCLWL